MKCIIEARYVGDDETKTWLSKEWTAVKIYPTKAKAKEEMKKLIKGCPKEILMEFRIVT